MSVLRLKTLLAITQNGKAQLKNMVADFTKFFQKDQSAFIGRRNTYEAKSDTVDEPSRRSYQKIVTTVDEKLKYLIANMSEYIGNVMDQEATNASGVAKAELVVGGTVWGNFSSGELLRLKSLVEDGSFKLMINAIPVRSDAEVWEKSDQDEYKDRAVFEKKKLSSVNKTITKVQYILEDPNIEKLNNSGKIYTPITATKDTVVELGEITTQEFSGAWSHHQRAGALKRIEELRTGIIKALEKANDVDVVNSELKGKQFFDFIFGDIK